MNTIHQPETSLSLTPLLHEWVHQLVADSEGLVQAIQKHQSPLNVHHLTPFHENISAYRSYLMH